jgi:hypothetical protein
MLSTETGRNDPHAEGPISFEFEELFEGGGRRERIVHAVQIVQRHHLRLAHDGSRCATLSRSVLRVTQCNRPTRPEILARMDEVWGADGRRIEVYKYAGRAAVYSDEPIPELIEREVLSGWGWRVSERSKDRDGSRRGGPNLPDSGPPRFTSREALCSVDTDQH